MQLPVKTGNGCYSGRYELDYYGPSSGLSILKDLPEHRPAIKDS